MANLKELYQKITSRYYSAEDVLEFIELAAKAINPDKEYNPTYTIAAIQNGFGDSILSMVIESVEKNPDKIGFQVTKLWSKPNPLQIGDGRTLLKIIIYDN